MTKWFRNTSNKISQMKRLSHWRLSFLISIVYTILGTIYSFYAVHTMLDSGVLYFLFFPVTFFAQLILFTTRDPFFSLLIAQSISMLICAAFLWLFFKATRED